MNGTSKGFAFVEFKDPAACETAIKKCDGVEVCGRTVGEERRMSSRPRFRGGLFKSPPTPVGRILFNRRILADKTRLT